jgi:hypothetical protein
MMPCRSVSGVTIEGGRVCRDFDRMFSPERSFLIRLVDAMRTRVGEPEKLLRELSRRT